MVNTRACVGSEGFYLTNTGLEFQVDHLSANVSEWSVVSVVYNGVAYPSAAALMAAYNANTLTKYVMPFTDEVLAANTLHRRGAARPLEDRPAPRLVEPGGKRFVVQGNLVKYLGWSFQVRSRGHGVGFTFAVCSAAVSGNTGRVGVAVGARCRSRAVALPVLRCGTCASRASELSTVACQCAVMSDLKRTRSHII